MITIPSEILNLFTHTLNPKKQNAVDLENASKTTAARHWLFMTELGKLFLQYPEVYKSESSEVFVMSTVKNILSKILRSIWTIWGYRGQACTQGQKYTFYPKIHNFQNLICDKIHIFKISFMTKFTFSKSHFSQHSQFQSLIFTKFTFSNSHFSQNSQFQNLIFHKIHIFETSFFTKFTFFKHHV